MFIADEPFISNECLDYLEESQHPVLTNAFARDVAGMNGRELNFVDAIPTGTHRIVTTSEAPLAWVTRHTDNENLKRAVVLMKDKVAMRRILAALQPDYRFDEVSLSQLDSYKPDPEQLPLVLKPAIGFYSVGVYTVHTLQEWDTALADIHTSRGSRAIWDTSVVDDSRFIVESFIEGTEYAVDVFYDADGKAVVLDVMEHDFSSAEDVSDRLYFTDVALMERLKGPLTSFFDRVNEQLDCRNLPCHVELRVKDGNITPIEFNPLRFAGLCTTDLSWFAYGFKTYERFLSGEQPDWDAAFSRCGGKRYAFVMFSQLPGEEPLTNDELAHFDYDALSAEFRDSLCALRRLPYDQLSTVACLIIGADATNTAVFDRALHMSLREFV